MKLFGGRKLPPFFCRRTCKACFLFQAPCEISRSLGITYQGLSQQDASFGFWQKRRCGKSRRRKRRRGRRRAHGKMLGPGSAEEFSGVSASFGGGQGWDAQRLIEVPGQGFPGAEFARRTFRREAQAQLLRSFVRRKRSSSSTTRRRFGGQTSAL